MNTLDLAGKYEVDVIDDDDDIIHRVALAMYKKGVGPKRICEELDITPYRLKKWVDETALRPPSRYKGSRHFNDVNMPNLKKYRGLQLVDVHEPKPKCKGDDEG